jgi:hypothetical protein
VATFDNYAARTLQDIAEHRNRSLTLSHRILSAISPFGAWGLLNVGHTEDEVKHVFRVTATKISQQVERLLEDAFEQFHNLDNINVVLDRIKELCQEELGDIPATNVLGALWDILARPDDWERYKSHRTLLEDITKFYKSASYVVEHTTAALNRMEAELEEFRDDFAMPGLILKDYPLEVIIEMLRKAGQRIEAGELKLKHVEAS